MTPLSFISNPRFRLHPVSPLDGTETLTDWDQWASAQTTPHPIGFNVRPGADYAKLLLQIKAMGGVQACVFHEYSGGLHNLHQFAQWVKLRIWRPAEFTTEKLHLEAPDAEHWEMDRRAEMTAAGFAPGDLWLHLHNEAGWTREMITWEIIALGSGIPLGQKFVCLNQGVGNPNEHHVGLAHDILHFASAYPDQVAIGVHEYFSVFGGRSYPWYLGRWQATSAELNGGHSFESYRKAQGWPDVNYVITEAGAEDIRNDHPFTDSLPRVEGLDFVGPVHANDAAWRQRYGAAYPGKDAQYLEEIKVAWDVGRWGDARVKGICLFSWGA